MKILLTLITVLAHFDLTGTPHLLQALRLGTQDRAGSLSNRREACRQ